MTTFPRLKEAFNFRGILSPRVNYVALHESSFPILKLIRKSYSPGIEDKAADIDLPTLIQEAQEANNEALLTLAQKAITLTQGFENYTLGSKTLANAFKLVDHVASQEHINDTVRSALYLKGTLLMRGSENGSTGITQDIDAARETFKYLASISSGHTKNSALGSLAEIQDALDAQEPSNLIYAPRPAECHITYD